MRQRRNQKKNFLNLRQIKWKHNILKFTEQNTAKGVQREKFTVKEFKFFTLRIKISNNLNLHLKEPKKEHCKLVGRRK